METTTTKTSNLTYRSYNENDIDDILDLWKEESGWGGITRKQFDQWFINTPYGKCIIVVTADTENKVVGQVIFSPSRMIVDGRVIKAMRISAPILKSDFRQGNIKDYHHPAFSMVREGFQLARDAGYQYTYSFPAFGWLGVWKLLPLFFSNPSDTAAFDCFAIALDDANTFRDVENEFKVVVSSGFSEDYDYLWRDAIQNLPLACGIVREAKWLKWIIGGHLVLETRAVADNSLIGYMAIKKETGLITDVLAGNKENLKKVFNYSVNAIHQKNDTKIPVSFSHLKGMLTPQTTPVVESIGFSKNNYRFAFCCYLLDPDIPFERVQAPQWYMTPMG